MHNLLPFYLLSIYGTFAISSRSLFLFSQTPASTLSFCVQQTTHSDRRTTTERWFSKMFVYIWDFEIIAVKAHFVSRLEKPVYVLSHLSLERQRKWSKAEICLSADQSSCVISRLLLLLLVMAVIFLRHCLSDKFNAVWLGSSNLWFCF